ncbi:MAG TPA: cytidine deaminase, partial [Candidatus Cryptobacteroides merdipullorum]|nr:cytidine deaminase [Candidatus Cryptobacteroides merdipullorum]
MTEKEIRIVYTEYSSFDELSPEDRELAEAAVDAMGGAYAPYSHFHVGAAVRLSDGSIVKGANQEN